MVKLHIIDGLIRADIAGTDHDLFRCQCFQDLSVRVKLFFLSRICFAVQIYEFRPEQAYAFGIVDLYCAYIRRSAYIRVYPDRLPVDGRTAFAFQILKKRFLADIFLLLFGEAFHKVIRRVDIYAMIVPVQDRCFPVPVIFDILALDQSRKIHAAGQDRRMGIAAAFPSDHAKEQGFVQFDGLRRRKIIRHQDRRLCALHTHRIQPHKDVQHIVFNIDHVSAPGLEIRIAHG